jgi:hypothetical protein
MSMMLSVRRRAWPYGIAIEMQPATPLARRELQAAAATPL